VGTLFPPQPDEAFFREIDPAWTTDTLKRFTVVDESIALNQPSESNSGRYWYNLHLVLVVADRARFWHESDFAKLS